MKRGFIQIYLFVGTLLLGIFFLGFLFGHNVSYAYFWADPRDTFMDYYNCISRASRSISYQGNNIYPPLCWFIFNICRLLSGDIRGELNEMGGNVRMLKTLQIPTIVFTILLMLCILLVYCFISELWNFEKIQKQWAVILLMLSIPFLFTIERGNILLLSFVGTLAFFVMKDSEKRWVRDVGYLCLAFAAAIKIYPAIFGFILIKEKKYKEACRLAIYGLVLFVVPFLFFCEEGLRGIPLFFENLLGFNAAYGDTVANQTALESGATENIKEVMDTIVNDGARIGYAAFMEHLFMWLGMSIGTATKVAAKAGMILSLVAFAAAFLSRKKWQSILLFTCVLAGFQSRSYVYTAIFLIVPFIFFMKEERTGWNWIYFILMILILFPLPFGWTEHLNECYYYIEHRSFNALQIGGALWGITIVSLADVIIHFAKQLKKPKIINA